MSQTTTQTVSDEAARGASKTLRLCEAAADEPHYSAGGRTYRVAMAMHAEARAKLCRALAARGEAASGTVVLLEGGGATTRHDTDHEEFFRQESFFAYLFGVKEPDCVGVLDAASGRATLFVPRLPAEYATWMGEIKPCAWFREHYAVDACHYVDELGAVLRAGGARKLLLLEGVNTDSGNSARPAAVPAGGDGEAFEVDRSALFAPLVECRVVKTAREIDLLRHVCGVSAAAHEQVMRRVRPGMTEFQIEALFKYYCHHTAGFRHVGYTCICASGPHGSVLHYGHAGAPNDRTLGENDMLLLDMGGEYHTYGADVTRSYPVTGKFDDRQRTVYNIVLAAQQAVFDAIKPGVSYVDMHLLAERTTLEGLVKAGVLKGDVDEMMKVRLGAVFQPHGLGHFLGIDTHDVGGYGGDAVERSKAPGLKSLRLTRTMKEGMVLTVEPGCYFNDHLLDKALADDTQKHFFNVERLAEFRGFGGVRIEDDIVITADGMENLSPAVRTIDEIEALMAEKLPLPFD